MKMEELLKNQLREGKMQFIENLRQKLTNKRPQAENQPLASSFTLKPILSNLNQAGLKQGHILLLISIACFGLMIGFLISLLI